MPKRKHIGPKRVEVLWCDAASDRNRGWISRGDSTQWTPYLITSLGYLMRHDDKVLVLAQNMTIDGETVSSFMDIPAPYVKKVRPL